MKALKGTLMAGALVMALLAPSAVWAEYGGQGPIEPYNPLIKAEKEAQHARGNPQVSDAGQEAKTGHLTTNPFIVNLGDGSRAKEQTAPRHTVPEPQESSKK
ncbi:MAG: hypothetical protein ACYCW6_19005 [Candidatus Xenobia bacterium]